MRFGPVFNRSKMRLMGGVTGRSYYVGSSAGPFLNVIGAVMRRSRYQSPGLLEFSADGAARKESRAELNPFR